MICQVAVLAGVDPVTALAVADFDHGLFETWVEELGLVDVVDRKTTANTYEAAVAVAQLVSLHRNEFLASHGVSRLPDVWIPAALRAPAPTFSPREFARAHFTEGG